MFSVLFLPADPYHSRERQFTWKLSRVLGPDGSEFEPEFCDLSEPHFPHLYNEHDDTYYAL